ncbi:MAG: hypothetical protein E7297_05270 [Lachnospiraceae bacterium]|jgi:adenosylcobinamide kinase/adenosylcobinamide-phosphate guanylyltransferase|nr:hypothetical protein [Lachnospiraceae bacterium]
MILVIGGFGQGKLESFQEYMQSQNRGLLEQIVEEDILDGDIFVEEVAEPWTKEEVADEVVLDHPIIFNHFHDMVRCLYLDDTVDHKDSVEEIETYLWSRLQKTLKNCKWILCDEVGNGVIPISGADRDYRMVVGRLQSRLAKEAEEVYRMTCGMPTKIK